MLDEKHTSAAIVDTNITDITVVNGHIGNVSCDGETTAKNIYSKDYLLENDNIKEVEELKGVDEDTELIEDEAALD